MARFDTLVLEGIIAYIHTYNKSYRAQSYIKADKLCITNVGTKN